MYERYPMGIPNYNVTVMTQVYNGKSIEYIAYLSRMCGVVLDKYS